MLFTALYFVWALPLVINQKSFFSDASNVDFIKFEITLFSQMILILIFHLEYHIWLFGQLTKLLFCLFYNLDLLLKIGCHFKTNKATDASLVSNWRYFDILWNFKAKYSKQGIKNIKNSYRNTSSFFISPLLGREKTEPD